MQHATLLDAFNAASGFARQFMDVIGRERQYELDNKALAASAEGEQSLSMAVAENYPLYRNDPETYKKKISEAVSAWARKYNTDGSRYYQDKFKKIEQDIIDYAERKTTEAALLYQQDVADASYLETDAVILGYDDPARMIQAKREQTGLAVAGGRISNAQAAEDMNRVIGIALDRTVQKALSLEDMDAALEIIGAAEGNDDYRRAPNSPERLRQARIEVVTNGLKRAAAITSPIKDYQEKHKELEEIRKDTRYKEAEGKDGIIDTADKAALHSYWDYNYQNYAADHSVFTQLLTDAQIAREGGDLQKANRLFQEATDFRAEKQPAVSALVKAGGGGKVDPKNLNAMDTWYKSAALDQWLNPDNGSGSKSKAIQALAEEKLWLYNTARLPGHGDELLNFVMENRADLSPEFQSKAIAAVITGSGNDLTGGNDQKKRLEAALKVLAPSGDVPAEEKIAWNDLVNDLIISHQSNRNQGITGEALAKSVDSMIAFTNSKVLMKAVTEGNLGSIGLFGGEANKTLKAFVYYGNQGVLDDLFNSRLTPDGRERFTVGGEKTTALYSQANEEGKKILEDLLKKEGVNLESWPGELAGDGSGDLDGYIRYRGTDGNWYRLGLRSETDNFYAERLEEDGEWKPFKNRKSSSAVLREANEQLHDLYESGSVR